MTSELAARERAVTEAEAELARRSQAPPVPTGFLAGLDALAKGSHERRSRRDQSWGPTSRRSDLRSAVELAVAVQHEVARRGHPGLRHAARRLHGQPKPGRNRL